MTARPFVAFRVRSYRFQWPADLLTAWAFEMENLILGWYVLVETGSVVLLTAFGALIFIGTLLAPMFGVVADRVGRRVVLCSMRAFYFCLALIIMGLALAGLLSPHLVLGLAFLAGLIRPSDIVMRNSLIGDTIPAAHLANAVGLTRGSMDTARIFGALAGAGLFAALGMARAYMIVAVFYLASLALTLGVSGHRPGHQTPASEKPSRWRELKEGLVFIWNTPTALAVMWIAVLVNATAFPLSHGLLPYVAREIYQLEQTGLSHLVAGFATGALIGSLTFALIGRRGRPARFMIVNVLLWYALLAVFSRFESKLGGLPTLLIMGIAHSMAMTSMSVTLLGSLTDKIRGRVMGVRMLAVYSLPVGLMVSGGLIELLGYQTTAALYVSIGISVTLLIAYKWRRTLWD